MFCQAQIPVNQAQIPVNVFPEYSNSHGLLGPLPKYSNLIFFFHCKEQEEWRPFVRGWLAVSSGRWSSYSSRWVYKEGQSAPSWLIFSAPGVQSIEPTMDGNRGKPWPKHVVPRPAASASSGTCQKCRYLGSPPVQQNQKLWVWDPGICFNSCSR